MHKGGVPNPPSSVYILVIVQSGAPNVYAYMDFRSYLSDFQKYKQSKDRKFNYAHLSRQLGVPNTRGFFKSIIKRPEEGGRELTRLFLNRLLEYVLDFDSGEEEYFRLLVDYNQSQDRREQEILYQKLLDINQVPTVAINSLKYYSDWTHAVVRALVDTRHYPSKSGPTAADLMVNISQEKLKQSVKLLADLGLIEIKEGFWALTDKVLTLDSSLSDTATRRYQMACLELGKLALLEKSVLWKRVYVNTVSLSPKASEQLLLAYEKFKKKIRALVSRDPDPAEEVYQINLQIVPLADGRKKP